jgi:hypothetical protein
MRRTRAAVEQLASILRALDDATQDPAQLDAVLSAFPLHPRGPFTGVALLVAREGHSFVLTASRSCDSRTVAAWRRWPLQRLFVRMKPARIRDPRGSGLAALAVPLAYRAERCVVIAPLVREPVSSEYRAFFEALENVRMPEAQGASPAFGDSAPEQALVLAFALCEELHDLIAGILRDRGWELIQADNFARLYDLLAAIEPDVVIIDSAEVADALSAVRIINRLAVRSAPTVMALGMPSGVSAEAASLIDHLLPHDATGAQIFATLKKVVRGGATRRSAYLDRLNFAAQERLQDVTSLQQLAELAADHAATLIHGWSALALVGENGSVCRAEHPTSATPLLSSIPNGFLAEAPVFCTRIDERFLAEVTDDASERHAIAQLRPVSGASLPIVLGRRRLGVLVALSQERGADANAFDALERFTARIARSFHDVELRRAFIPEFSREGCWERWRGAALNVAIYRSPDCTTPYVYRSVTARRGVLTLGIAHDDSAIDRFLHDAAELRAPELRPALSACIAGPNRFAAVVDAATGSMAYASRDFLPPLVAGAHGPSGAIGRSRQITTGIAALSPSAETVVCDRRLWKWFSDRSSLAGDLHELLEQRSPPGLASVVTLRS